MKKICSIGTMALVLVGCSPDGKSHEQATRKPRPTSVVRRVSGPVVTSVPTAIISGGKTTVVGNASQQFSAQGATDGPPLRTATATAPADATLVFDLATLPLDAIALAKQGIRLRELNNVRILEFGTNSSGFGAEVKNIPTGAMARTVYAVGRCDSLKSSYMMNYGRFGSLRTACSFAICQGGLLCFVGYGADLNYKVIDAGEYYAMAFVYDGSLARLYVNDQFIASNNFTLATPHTVLSIGQGMVGSVLEIKIWNRCMGDKEIHQVFANTKESLADIL